MRWWTRSAAATAAGAAAPTADDVRALYEELLGRTPSDDEVRHQREHAPDLRTLLHALVAGDEFRGRHPDPARAPDPHLVNVWTEELAAYGHAPGTWSDDGVAVVGRDGWVFLGTGTNAVVDQYRDRAAPAPGWHEAGGDAVSLRRREAERLGAAYVGIVVPDKLALAGGRFPEELPADARPPAARLAADADLDLVFPTAELEAVPEGAYLRTDTHLTYAGNAALAAAVVARLGLDLAPPAVELVRHPMSGDLGSRFRPQIVEVARIATTFGAAELVEDNRAEISAVGAHIGSRRVLRNPTARDARTVVVFGDSYAFPDPAYQGLGWFLAQWFREVHAVWVPFGWDPAYVEQAGAEVVICQMAERFVVRAPGPAVDVLALAAETIARGSAIVVDELHSPASS
jgi:alginate O-acetyltransferase complex protein AlgJ